MEKLGQLDPRISVLDAEFDETALEAEAGQAAQQAAEAAIEALALREKATAAAATTTTTTTNRTRCVGKVCSGLIRKHQVQVSWVLTRHGRCETACTS